MVGRPPFSVNHDTSMGNQKNIHMNKYFFAIAVFLLWLFLIASSASAQWTVEWIDIDDAHGAGQSLEVDVEIIGTTANVTANRPCPASPRGETGVAEIWFNCGANNDTVIRPGGIIYSRSECGTKTYQITLPYLCGPTPCTTGEISDGDLDDDGVPDCVDNDIDGDNVENSVDPDIDGDDIPNELDCDIDSDGTLNINDDDIDGDHLFNGDDPDMDGDQIPNVGDDNPSGDVDYDNGLVPHPQGGFGQAGDGKPNCPCVDENSDFDGDTRPNHEDGNIDDDEDHNCNDDDIDGDGIPNDEDPDDDGDCILDEDDITPKGHGCKADTDGDGIPNACDADSGLCGDNTGPQGEPDGICDSEDCERYKDDDGDEVPNFCDADWIENNCNDDDGDGVCDDAECAEWYDWGEQDDDGDDIDNKCDKYPTPTSIATCPDTNKNGKCDGCEDSTPDDPSEDDYNDDQIPDRCDKQCTNPDGYGCYPNDCPDENYNNICDECEENGAKNECEDPRTDCPDYDCDKICDECDATCGGPGCPVRSDCIDATGPEDKPDGICDDCVLQWGGGGPGGGGSSGGDNNEEGCPDWDGDGHCDACDSNCGGPECTNPPSNALVHEWSQYTKVRDDCHDEDRNGSCDDCERPDCPDYDGDKICDPCDKTCAGPGCPANECFDTDENGRCDDCELTCLNNLLNIASKLQWINISPERYIWTEYFQVSLPFVNWVPPSIEFEVDTGIGATPTIETWRPRVRDMIEYMFYISLATSYLTLFYRMQKPAESVGSLTSGVNHGGASKGERTTIWQKNE